MASTKGRVKRGAEIGGGLAFLWFLAVSGTQLLGRWQEVQQAIQDWPGFVRWLALPQTPAVIVGIAAAIYLAAVLWPEPTPPAVDPLIGKFFHTFHHGGPNDGQLQYQGHIIRKQDGRYFIQLYSAVTGDPTDQRFMTEDELQRAVFYDTHAEWITAYQDWARRR